MFGNYDGTSVCIALEVIPEGLPKYGNINGIGGVTLADAIYLAKHVAEMSGYERLWDIIIRPTAPSLSNPPLQV